MCSFLGKLINRTYTREIQYKSSQVMTLNSQSFGTFLTETENCKNMISLATNLQILHNKESVTQ